MRHIVDGILLRDETPFTDLSRIEGLNCSLRNLGWLVGPVIAGFIIANFGVRTNFLFSFVVVVISIAYFFRIKLRNVDHHNYPVGFDMTESLTNIKSFISKPDLVKSYFMYGGSSLFFSFVFLYLPLIILESHIPNYWIGISLSLSALPLIFLEYYVGNMESKLGFKKLFTIGFSIICTFLFLAFLQTNVVAIVVFIVLAASGAAFLEGTRESYFFKLTNESEEEKYYGIIHTSRFTFSIFSKLVAALFLLFFPIRFVFLLAFIILIFFLATALTIKEPNHN